MKKFLETHEDFFVWLFYFVGTVGADLWFGLLRKDPERTSTVVGENPPPMV